MKVLVTGASGFVGQSVVKALKLDYVYVLAVGRDLSASDANESISIPDYCAQDVWQVPLSGCDVVIHLAARVHVMHDVAENPLAAFLAVNFNGTMNLAYAAAKANVKRFVYISSIKVNGELTEIGKPFAETDIPNPQDVYGISKLEAEQGLMLISKQTGMEIVIIRPPLVYGTGVKANFASMMRMVKLGTPLPLGAIHNKRSFVYIDNLVSLIVRCIDQPAAANQVFLVSDGNDLSTTELLRRCAVALGVKSRLVSIPQKLIEVFASLIGKKDVSQRLCGNLQVDITKARTLLDWTPPITVEEGLKATAMGFNKANK